MNKAIYISGTKGRSEKSLISIGMMHLLLGKVGSKIGYFKPLINDNDKKITTIVKHFGLEQDYGDSYSYTLKSAMNLFNRGYHEKILDSILNKYNELMKKNDFVLVEGLDMEDYRGVDKADINIALASNLALPVILVCSAKSKTNQEILSEINISYDRFVEEGIKILGIVVNNCNSRTERFLTKGLNSISQKKIFIRFVPENEELQKKNANQILDNIDCEVLSGKENLNDSIDDFVVGTMNAKETINRIKDNSFVVTSGDRIDILLGLLSLNLTHTKLSGILLTSLNNENKIDEKILDIIKSQNIPVLTTYKKIENVLVQLYRIESEITVNDSKKIDICINSFEKYLNKDDLFTTIISFENTNLSPRIFLYNLFEKAKQNKRHIVLPEAQDDRILKASVKLVNQDIVNITLLGEKGKIESNIKRLGLKVESDNLTIINPIESEKYEEYWKTFYELRKNKGINETIAKDIMLDGSYFGTMMVYKGDADGMVSGAVNTTQHTIRPALQFIKTKKDVSVVSSVFFMCLKDRVYVFGDCAVNTNPTSEELSEIAIMSSETAKSFGIEPKVAMLSYSSGSSGKGEDVDKIKVATKIIKEKRPDLKVEGPIQYDAAVDISVGTKKLPDSEVAGKANVFIFPDLNTGNNTYKAVQRETDALAIGPVLQGLNKAVNDLSRGCTEEDIYNTVIITSIQSVDNN